jgi:IS30 family transposase
MVRLEIRPASRPSDMPKPRRVAITPKVGAGLSPTAAARQLGLGRSTVYREVSRLGIQRGS